MGAIKQFLHRDSCNVDYFFWSLNRLNLHMGGGLKFLQIKLTTMCYFIISMSHSVLLLTCKCFIVLSVGTDSKVYLISHSLFV